jgi:glycine cleavage system aminomethyltransferase T
MVIAHREPGGLPGANTVFKVRATAFVIAMGSVERPITFIDNDRPGVMLLSAAERYLARFGVRVGSDVVVFANHDRAYTSAARLLAGGLRVRAIVDTRSESEFAAGGEFAARARAELSRAGVECLLEHAVIAAVGGAAGMKGAIVGARSISGNSRSIACDALLVSGGWTPAVNAGTQDGGALRFSNDARAFTAAAQPAWRQSAGAADGMLELSDALASGHSAGDRAARYAGAQGSAGSAPRATGDSTPRLVPFWRSPANRSAEKRQFVDFQNDVTVADLRQALEEGFIDIEHIKRYTTLGVGTEQGSTGNFLGTMIVAELKGERVTEVGASRLRPPYHPVTLRSLAGHRVGLALRVARRTPLHDWHVAHGAALESMGLWMRPRYYRANGCDAYTAGVIEATRVRASGGITDGSTLGKIEIAGADAGAFLDRLYLTKASSIKAGRGKYMVNLREDGMVLDDGLVLRLSDDRFFATTSSAHAEGILSHLEYYCETEFAGQKVSVTDVTEAWAVIVVAGPESRATLFRVLGSEWQALLRRLAHMEFLAGRWREREVRVLRASFSGELAYELHCRPEIALQLWQALVDAGLSPYGLEALDILRIEKGYLASSEINGQTTPFDLGMQSLVKIGNSCVGSNLLDRAAFHEPTRPCLVGLRAEDGHGKFLAGAQLTAPNGSNRPCGFVTSSAFSPALGEWIGLGLAARSLATDASVLVARDPVRGGDTTVRVVSPVHFDSAGARLKS